jgi:hypothetical protein
MSAHLKRNASGGRLAGAADSQLKFAAPPKPLQDATADLLVHVEAVSRLMTEPYLGEPHAKQCCNAAAAAAVSSFLKVSGDAEKVTSSLPSLPSLFLLSSFSLVNFLSG